MNNHPTYRAAYWTDGRTDVRLTSEEHKDLTYDELMEFALMEAEQTGLAIGDGEIRIGDYTE